MARTWCDTPLVVVANACIVLLAFGQYPTMFQVLIVKKQDRIDPCPP